MSMLSAQCDELRSMAESVGLAMPQAATLMLEAADTIWELRDDLQRANAENAKLRSELESVGTAAYLYGRSDLNDENVKLREIIADLEKLLPESERCYIHETVKAIAENNARLRKLVADMWPHVRHRSRMCSECELPCDTSDECLLYEPMRQRMRELGVEVASV